MENNDNNPKNDEVVDKKAVKIEKEKQYLISKVLSGNLENSRDKVGFILNNFYATRNSDIELVWKYWCTFESGLFNGRSITKNDLTKLTNFCSIIRSRARIQNEYKLFQAEDIIKKYRGALAEEKMNEAIEEKPTGMPMYSVYIDETGKTQKYLSVGSLWVVDGYQTFESTNRLNKWIEKRKITHEFHFNGLTKNKLDIYKEFFLKFLEFNPTIGFKIIIIDNKGLSNINNAITDLTFHLLYEGIKHENTTKRAPLPRQLYVSLDEDEKGSDSLKIANLRERITGQKIKDLFLGEFLAVNSKYSIQIQVVDLFTAAINRKLHNPDSEGNFKDELADYILGLLNFDLKKIDLNNSEIDKSTVFNLSYNNNYESALISS